MMPLADYDNLAAVHALVADAVSARRGETGIGPTQIEDDVMRKVAPGTALFTMASLHARNIAHGILKCREAPSA